MIRPALIVLALGLALGACATAEHVDHVMAAASAQAMPHRAVAHVQPTKGNHASGEITFTAMEGGGVRVTGRIAGLSPNGVHAIHLHECGDCSADDGSSAGGHYDPEGRPHGAPDAPMHHAGDFGNLQANAEGVAEIDLACPDLSIAGPRNAVIGRAVIVHAKADDLVSQPTGAAGGRIGCGVVGVAKDEPAK